MCSDMYRCVDRSDYADAIWWALLVDVDDDVVVASHLAAHPGASGQGADESEGAPAGAGSAAGSPPKAPPTVVLPASLFEDAAPADDAAMFDMDI